MAPKKHKQKQKTQPKPLPTTSQKRKSNKSMLVAIAVIAIVIIAFGAIALSGQLGGQQQAQTTFPPTKVLLQTTAGNITIDLRTDKPITSGNFKNLVQTGRYDGSTFDRTVAGFMIQAGKVKGSVANINDEIGINNHNAKYTIAMANTGEANTASSEFFINVADNTNLDSKYTVFGNVTLGRDVVDTIANAPALTNPNMPWNETSLPVNPVTILHATIVP
jgi:cyclophilin family peptidyl-prolyl cis-trans isomerase